MLSITIYFNPPPPPPSPSCVCGVVVFKTGVSVCVYVRVFFDLVVVVLKFSAYNLSHEWMVWAIKYAPEK